MSVDTVALRKWADEGHCCLPCATIDLLDELESLRPYKAAMEKLERMAIKEESISVSLVPSQHSDEEWCLFGVHRDQWPPLSHGSTLLEAINAVEE